MEVDFAQPLVNAFGEPLKDDGNDLKLGDVAVAALSGTFQGDKRDSTQRTACWKLAMKIVDRSAAEDRSEGESKERRYNTVELTAKEIAMLQGLIEQFYPAPVICAQATELLEKGGPEK